MGGNKRLLEHRGGYINNVPYSWTLSLGTLMQLSYCQSHLLYLTVDRYTVCPGDVAERKQGLPFHLGREMEQR